MTSRVLVLLLVVAAGVRALDPELELLQVQQDDEAKARAYLDYLNKEYGKRQNEASLAEWGYASNITEETLAKKLAVSAEVAKFQKQQWQETIKFPWTTYKDPDIRRQFKKYSVLGTAALPDDKFEKLEKLISEMESIYSTAKICSYQDQNKCDLSLEPELVELLTKSRDPKELEYVWVQWRKESGEKCRGLFEHYVALSNEAAVLNNFTDTSQYWLKDYETEDFQEQVAELWEQLRPLYTQLHAYVRRRLREQYGETVVSNKGPIPAHLLGNMWAQSWANILETTVPFKGKEAIDVTPQMTKQGYTPLRMFKLAEQFFTSLNLSAMPELFWERSILSKPEDREIICHASAWDFYDAKDFRIKQCTRSDMQHLLTVHHEMGHVQYFLQYKDQPLVYREGANPGTIKQCTQITGVDLYTAHHEMGHVQYYLQYKHQPVVYRRGANPGFHEAVGDVMSLSVSTPKHLKKIGLLDSSEEDNEATINFLFLQGLQKIAFLPYAYLLDLWRWDVFKGKINSDEYNCKWWKLRTQYQGIEPPVDRTEEDFDAGGKYHVIASVPYIRYFVSYVIQFQFHRALCEKAGQFDPNDPSKPLHECDIYQSTEAGNLLGRMLQMGSSKPWPDAMEVITGQRRMDAGGLLDYFRPLQKWLEEENARTGEYIGWEDSQKVCVKSRLELERLKAAATPSEETTV